MRSCALGLAFLAATPVPAVMAQQADSTMIWLAWQPVTFLVRADTALGLELVVSAEVQARAGGEESRGFMGRFPPDAIESWVQEALLLLLPDNAAPGDPPTELTTSAIFDVRGGRFLAARTREGRRWSTQVILSFRASGEEPLAFRLPRRQAETLFAALGGAARRSRLAHLDEARTVDGCRIPMDDPKDTTVVPPVRVSGPPPVYPGDLKNRGISGKVFMAVTIDTSGTPVDVHAVFSTHRGFAQSAAEAVARSRFTPAMRDGRVIEKRICLPVSYGVNQP